MKQELPFCQGYGTRAQGICPFDFAGGICRGCPESVAAFGGEKNISKEFFTGLAGAVGKARRGA